MVVTSIYICAIERADRAAAATAQAAQFCRRSVAQWRSRMMGGANLRTESD
jgi:hypothetical protein